MWRLVDSGGELYSYNVASTAAHTQIYVAYTLFIIKVFTLIYVSNLYSGRLPVLNNRCASCGMSTSLRNHALEQTVRESSGFLIRSWLHYLKQVAAMNNSNKDVALN
jgi:hypothetical protein